MMGEEVIANDLVGIIQKVMLSNPNHQWVGYDFVSGSLYAGPSLAEVSNAIGPSQDHYLISRSEFRPRYFDWLITEN